MFHPVVGLHSNGILYGTDPDGGPNGDGLVFALSATNQLSTVHSFAGADGSGPNGRLALLSNVIFGTAVGGGANKTGTIWSINQSHQNQFTVLHSFVSSTDGTEPRDGVVVDPQNGLLVGTSSAGAVSPGDGAIFSMSASGAFTTNWEFLSGTDGHCPYSGVAVDSLGNIYGTTVGYSIGGDPMGSIWGLAPGGMVQTLYVFTDGPEGKYPTVAPSVDGAGNVWGVSNARHSKPYAGVIWEITPANGFQIVYTLNGTSDGFAPNAPLVLGHDGNFYGTTTSGGGVNSLGTLFRINPTTGAFSVVHSFAGGSDGGTPTGNLIVDSVGQIFGGTALGTIFRYKP